MKAISPAAVRNVRQFGREVKCLNVVGDIVGRLNVTGEAYLFGGGARDACFGRGKMVNDLDVVVSGLVDVSQSCFRSLSMRRTNFGGYRFNAGNYEMDLWRLDESYAFSQNPRLTIGIGSLLRTVCFTTDAIALSLRSGTVFASRDFQKSFEDKSLGFVTRPDALDPLVATRAVRLLLKLDLCPDFEVASYILNCADSFGVHALVEREMRWHGIHFLNRLSLDAVLRKSNQVCVRKRQDDQSRMR